jgi:hypothetical protein
MLLDPVYTGKIMAGLIGLARQGSFRRRAGAVPAHRRPAFAARLRRRGAGPEGDTLVIVESMKMEIPISAPASGVVTEILMAEGEPVADDQVVIHLD